MITVALLCIAFGGGVGFFAGWVCGKWQLADEGYARIQNLEAQLRKSEVDKINALDKLEAAKGELICHATAMGLTVVDSDQYMLHKGEPNGPLR